MRLVFVHRRGIGQFEHLARRLVAEGAEVTLVTETVDRKVDGVRVLRHRAERAQRAGDTALVAASHHARIGLRVAETLDALKRCEGPPDLVVGHIGWGSMTFVKDVLPQTPALGYCEFFYSASGADVGFDPAMPVDLALRQRLRLRNSAQLVTLAAIEGGLAPTAWQRSLYPEAFRRRIAVGHDGIDLRRFRPDADARLVLPDGRTLRPGDPVVTFAARDLEPYRGFPQAVRAARLVMDRHPEALFVFVGGDGVSYGAPRPDGRSWKAAVLEEAGLDPARVYCPGRVSHVALTRLFQVSAAHVYLTYPFVLSWSMLEAMACGALVVGSATPPVEEVIADGRNGLLVPFFDPQALADTLLDVLGRGAELAPLRRAARATVAQRFGLDECLARQRHLVDRLVGRSRPAAVA